MQPFVDIYGFLSVVLRGLILSAQSLTIGGIAFLIVLVWPLRAQLGTGGIALASRARRLICAASLVLAVAELLAAGALIAMLMGTLDICFSDAMGARAVIVDLLVAMIGLLVFVSASKQDATPGPLLGLGLLLLAIQTGSTHSVSQFHDSESLSVAEFLHLLGAGVWIGGIPYFLMAFAEVEDHRARAAFAHRFSQMSLGAVALLLAGGVLMAVTYIDAPAALYGGSYGLMLSAKVVLLLGLLALGGFNFLAIRKLKGAAGGPLLRTRRFAEVEIGVGLTVLFCAASLASLPPPRDLPNDRASVAEIVARVAPLWPPRLESPAFASVSAASAATATLPSSAQIRTSADIAWSEYNHNWAGVFVIAMGVLALLEHLIPRLSPLARQWPMMFIGLAGFLFLRADETVWPLGQLGLIESLRDPEIAQHRLITLLIVAFGVFEWRVRNGRSRANWAPYVFPLSTAVAAAFLLTHSHGLGNPKEETLIEFTHTPLALVGVAAAWSRWLELRLDDRAGRIASYVWPVALILAGLMLLFYREA